MSADWLAGWLVVVHTIPGVAPVQKKNGAPADGVHGVTDFLSGMHIFTSRLLQIRSAQKSNQLFPVHFTRRSMAELSAA